MVQTSLNGQVLWLMLTRIQISGDEKHQAAGLIKKNLMVITITIQTTNKILLTSLGIQKFHLVECLFRKS